MLMNVPHEEALGALGKVRLERRNIDDMLAANRASVECSVSERRVHCCQVGFDEVSVGWADSVHGAKVVGESSCITLARCVRIVE